MIKTKLLITGVAGFIGASLCLELLKNHNEFFIVGIDNLNSYYDVSLKKNRLKELKKYPNFEFNLMDISNKEQIDSLFIKHKFGIVINLAAQAGVRYSIDHPDAYIQSNIIGFFNILEACRYNSIKHLIYASSSSVYGSNKKVPYSVEDKADQPVSLYAASKKSNELFAYSYCKLYDIPCTGLRFFTVYGPMGRPDMAYFKFTERAKNKESIQIYNKGDMYRDFTFIDDIVQGIVHILNKVPIKNQDGAKYKIYNIGNNKPVSLLFFVNTLEELLLQENIITSPIKKEFLPMQSGDVYQTYADVDDLLLDFNWKPTTSLKDGLLRFVKWYKEYYL